MVSKVTASLEIQKILNCFIGFLFFKSETSYEHVRKYIIDCKNEAALFMISFLNGNGFSSAAPHTVHSASVSFPEVIYSKE